MSYSKYVPSGALSVKGVLTTLIFGTIASIIIAFLYIVICRLIPNIWFIAIMCVMLGIGLGFCIDQGIKFGKIRNMKVAIIIAVFCGLLTFYMQWVVFDTFMYSQKGFTFKLSGQDIKILLNDMFFLFTHPGILFQEIFKLNEYGTFRVSSSEPVKGIFLWLLWAAEFLIIVGGAIYAVANGKVTQPFSELNDEWMNIRKPNYLINLDNGNDELVKELDSRNYHILKDETKDIDPNYFAEVVVYESNGDPTKFVNVSSITNIADKAGKVTTKRGKIVNYYAINDRNF